MVVVEPFVEMPVAVNSPQLCPALIAAEAENRIPDAYYRACVARVRGSCRRLPMLALGPRLLGRVLRAEHARVYHVPTAMVHPVHWRLRRQWLEPTNGHVTHDDAYCFMLTHEVMRRCSGMTGAVIVKSDTLLGTMFRRAPGLPGVHRG